MKKLILFALIFSVLFTGCKNETPPEVPPENPLPEISEEETDRDWENLVSEVEKKGFSKKDLEKLEKEGYGREELKEMSPDLIAMRIKMSKEGIKKEKVDFALEILNDPESYNNKKLVISGTSGTKNGDIIETFIESVEKNEGACVYGIMAGYTMPYYFELSFESGGFINIIQIYEGGFRTAEVSRIYDTETFWCFSGKEDSFSVTKTDLTPDEKPQLSEEEAKKLPITAEEAIERARKIMLSGEGEAIINPEEKSKELYGSYCGIVTEDYSAYADDYFKGLLANYEGTFRIGEKPFHLVYFYNEEVLPENFVGYCYYVSAENPDIVFSVSMVNGELLPIAFFPEPRVVLD